MSDTNTFSPSIPRYWSRKMQIQRFKTNQYQLVSSFEEKITLKKGNRVDRPYRSSLRVKTMGADGAYSRQPLTDTEEYLLINEEKEISFYVKDLEKIQHNYPVLNDYANDATKGMVNFIDGDVFGEYDQAASSVDAGDLGGNAGEGITPSTSNILKIFGLAGRKLTSKNIEMMGRWAIISPEFYDILWQYVAGRDTNLGDTDGKNGSVGKWGGFSLYVSNNLCFSGRLEMGTNPSEGDTVTFSDGTTTVTFTFNATPSGAGSVDIGSDAAGSIDNLVAAINAPETTSATFIALTDEDQLGVMTGVTATDGTTYMTVKGEGKSYLTVAETLTAEADIWTTTKQIQHQLFGQGKPIDVVIQKYPDIQIKDRSGYVGKDVVTWTAYGLKTFKRGTEQLVDVQIRSDAY